MCLRACVTRALHPAAVRVGARVHATAAAGLCAQVVANKENRELRVNKTLELMSAPKLWEMSDGTIKEVQTPATRRAKELADLYHGLNLTNLRVDERLDVLLHVKWTVKEFECNLTREIVDLIDRDADLLNRCTAAAYRIA